MQVEVDQFKRPTPQNATYPFWDKLCGMKNFGSNFLENDERLLKGGGEMNLRVG
jgi:hypothetical protein